MNKEKVLGFSKRIMSLALLAFSAIIEGYAGGGGNGVGT